MVVLPGNRGLRRFYHQVTVRPAEGIWSMLKASLANFTAINLDHLVQAIKRRLKMIQYQASLVDGCLTQTRLIMESTERGAPVTAN